MVKRKAAAIGWGLLGVVFMWEVYGTVYLIIARATGQG